ncbi:MAG: hypothetical protein E7409_02270 [Ruminococcaceae bacterium]|nr:hypothetical protein [Oscillospiraceae bacterium]
MRRFYKSILTAVLALVICVLPLCSFASPEVLPASYGGTVDYLINIKNPDTVTSTTSTRTYVLSAVGLPGTTVTLYSMGADGQYYKMYADGVALESVIGASGLYAQQITLLDGTNTILVRCATDAGEEQGVHLYINLLGQGFLDKLKAFTVDITNTFN